MKNKNFEKLYNLILNNYSKDLFNKSYNELNWYEINKLQDYIYDINNPKWKRYKLDGKDTSILVSNTGKVINAITGKYHSLNETEDGYLKASFTTMDGISMHRGVHRLVAQLFIPNPNNKPEVDHLNGNKKCNWVGNLEWVTSKENTHRAIENGLRWNNLGQKGEQNYTHIYADDQIKKVCQLLQDFPFMRPKEITEKTGVKKDDIYHIRNRQTWTHISKDYNFKKVNFRCGENNNQNKYTIDKIHEVCKLIEENPKIGHTEIEKITGVKKDTVKLIRDGKIWTNISSKYNIKKSNFSEGENKIQSIYSNKQIKKACELLMDPKKSYPEITKETGIPTATLNKIFKGEQWQSIAKEFDFPKERLRTRSPMAERISELLLSGKNNLEVTDIIQTEFEMESKRRLIQCEVSRIKNELKKKAEKEEKVNCSN